MMPHVSAKKTIITVFFKPNVHKCFHPLFFIFFFLDYIPWLVAHDSMPLFNSIFTMIWQGYQTIIYQISWIFVINQVPCVSSCCGEKTHTRGLQRKWEPHTSHYTSNKKKQPTNYSNQPLCSQPKMSAVQK